MSSNEQAQVTQVDDSELNSNLVSSGKGIIDFKPTESIENTAKPVEFELKNALEDPNLVTKSNGNKADSGTRNKLLELNKTRELLEIDPSNAKNILVAPHENPKNHTEKAHTTVIVEPVEENKSNQPSVNSNLGIEEKKKVTAITSFERVLEKNTTSAKTSSVLSPTEKSIEPDTEEIKNILEEFEYLIEKSQQAFSAVRELPPIGGSQWKGSFQKAFRIYAKLWEFQQLNREILGNPGYYGLKRWEIGEIASKIGQLYYQYYLRTSNVSFLREANIFYEAIGDRNYFRDILEVQNFALIIKKMRYFARFIVICLLLNNDDTAKSLTNDLAELVEEYFVTFNPVDKAEWRLVIKEIQIFTHGKNAFVPFDETGNLYNLTQLPPRDTLISYMQNTKPILSKALIIGNTYKQIKFSEMTLDMFKILHSLEYESLYSTGEESGKITSSSKVAEMSTAEPEQLVDISNTNEESAKEDKPLSKEKISNSNIQNLKDAVAYEPSKFPNPQKYLLFRIFISTLISSISSAFKEIDKKSCLLIYVSAEALSEIQETEDKQYQSGIIAASKKNIEKQANLMMNTDSKPDKKLGIDPFCLYPGDLISYTRKPLFLIVESSNSMTFNSMPKMFGEPLVILMSPTVIPEEVNFNSAASGNLYTIFLHSPVIGFCAITEISTLSTEHWNLLVLKMLELEDTIYKHLLLSIKDEGALFLFEDIFLRRFIIRHVLCYYTLSVLTCFSKEENLPKSKPDFVLPDAPASSVKEVLFEIAKELDVLGYFIEHSNNGMKDKQQYTSYVVNEDVSGENVDISGSQNVSQSQGQDVPVKVNCRQDLPEHALNQAENRSDLVPGNAELHHFDSIEHVSTTAHPGAL